MEDLKELCSTYKVDGYIWMRWKKETSDNLVRRSILQDGV
jgi:hypothetical protein